MENYSILRTIGKGSYAQVYLAVHKPTGRQVALKIINMNEVKDVERMTLRLKREIRLMKSLKHERIVEYFEHFESANGEHVIAMEYVSGGELFDLVLENEGLTEAQAKPLFYQIATAVAHCHKNGIAHRDLKLENILLDKDHKAKLADFGFSKETHAVDQLATYCGSTLYASPEMVLGRPYLGPECDIWGLGVILYAMLTASMPFDDRDWGVFTQSVADADYPEPPNTSLVAQDLISRMLQPDGKRRANIDDVLNHPWLQSMQKERKRSLQAARPQRVAVCHTNSVAAIISQKVIQEAINGCDGACHTDTTSNGHRDSAVVLHCKDCDFLSSVPLVPTDPLLSRKISVSSTCSSGYFSTESISSPLTKSVCSSTKASSSSITSVTYVPPSRKGCTSPAAPIQILCNIEDKDELDLVFA